MSNDAKRLIKLLEQGRNVLITGQAGTGKTTLIRHLAEQSKGEIALTATTGVAALSLGGTTIHSFTGINIQTSLRYVKTLCMYPFKWPVIVGRIKRAKVIVIDECSMLRPDTFALIDAVLKKATASSKVFGGKQLVLCGDFLQLPPVVKPEEGLPSPWVFQTQLWKEADFAVMHMIENFRQEDKLLAKALSEIRQGNCPPWVDDLFSKRDKIAKDLGIDPVRFVPKNAQAERINYKRLDALDGEARTYVASIWGENEKLREQIKRDCIAPQKLLLKKGAQVMVLINDEGEAKRFINGSMGTVVDFQDNSFPRVKIAKSGEVITFLPHEWQRKDSQDFILASFEQVPLKLAYAVTIHKSQGLTLDAAEMDCAGIFVGGQAYVGLSRVRTLEGLRLLNWDKGYIAANPDALNFYASLMASAGNEFDHE